MRGKPPPVPRETRYTGVFFPLETARRTIRVATHNVFMGLDARRGLASALWAQCAFWMALRPGAWMRDADVARNARPILEARPDLIGFTEVFGAAQVRTVIGLCRAQGLGRFLVTPSFQPPFCAAPGWLLYDVLACRWPMRRVLPTDVRNVVPYRLPWPLAPLLASAAGKRALTAVDAALGTTLAAAVPRLESGILHGSVMSAVVPELDLGVHFAHLPIGGRNDHGTAALLGKVIRRRREHGQEILMGDLNAGRGSLEKSVPWLFSCYANLRPDQGPTWSMPSGAKSPKGWLSSWLRKRHAAQLDYLLGTCAVESVGGGVATGGGSDHVGVWADVRLPGRAA